MLRKQDQEKTYRLQGLVRRHTHTHTYEAQSTVPNREIPEHHTAVISYLDKAGISCLSQYTSLQDCLVNVGSQNLVQRPNM